jgi:hypothetical protein
MREALFAFVLLLGSSGVALCLYQLAAHTGEPFWPGFIGIGLLFAACLIVYNED